MVDLNGPLPRINDPILFYTMPGVSFELQAAVALSSRRGENLNDQVWRTLHPGFQDLPMFVEDNN